jgi:RND family efflux transporter MFP subunit
MFKPARGWWRPAALWGLAFPGLIALNLARDLSISQHAYDWTRIKPATFRADLMVTGTLEAAAILNLKAEQDGAVEKVLVRPGQVVHEGQPLIAFSRTQILLEIQRQTEHCLALDKQIQMLRKRLDNQQKLLRKSAISPPAIDETKRLIELSRAKLEAARNERGETQKKLSDLRILAPFDGTVLDLHTTAGDALMRGSELLSIADNSKFLLRAVVDRAAAKTVAVGQTALIFVGGGKQLKGVVKLIEGNRGATIEIMHAKRAALTHGSQARASIRLNDIPNTLAVPTKAVSTNEQRHTTLVVRNKWGWVRQRRVTLGQESDDVVQVVKGLKADEFVGLTAR